MCVWLAAMAVSGLLTFKTGTGYGRGFLGCSTRFSNRTLVLLTFSLLFYSGLGTVRVVLISHGRRVT